MSDMSALQRLLGLMILGAVWLFRAFGREMDNPGA
jgi:hypothetical protein